MKKNIIILGALAISSMAFSQVGINTDAPKTTMDVSPKRNGLGVLTDNTKAHGLQAPRITRAELTANTASYGGDQRGALIYITDIAAGNTDGQRANITALGYYYFDGSFWQKVSNGTLPTGLDNTNDAFVNDAANNMVKLGTKADGTTTRDANTDFVIKDTGNVGIGTASPTHKLDVRGEMRVDNITNGAADVGSGDLGLFNQTSGMYNRYVTNNAPHRFFVDGATGNNFIGGTPVMVIEPSRNVGIGNDAPNARLDIRTDPGSTSNPGEGMFGLGTTSTAANTAGAGAMRYSTISGGILQYSNGTDWNTVTATVQKSIVVAKKTSSQTISNATPVNVTDWTEVNDNNNNFNQSTGEFTAPRNGVYVISFSFSFTASSIIANSRVEAQISTGDSSKDKKSIVGFTGSGNSEVGAAISFSVPLNQGEKIRPIIYQNTGSSQSLRVGSAGDDGFVNFSVAEL